MLFNCKGPENTKSINAARDILPGPTELLEISIQTAGDPVDPENAKVAANMLVESHFWRPRRVFLKVYWLRLLRAACSAKFGRHKIWRSCQV